LFKKFSSTGTHLYDGGIRRTTHHLVSAPHWTHTSVGQLQVTGLHAKCVAFATYSDSVLSGHFQALAMKDLSKQCQSLCSNSDPSLLLVCKCSPAAIDSFKWGELVSEW
jgi:hypothetical protein